MRLIKHLIPALTLIVAVHAQSDYSAPYYFTTLAGSVGGPGYTDGTGSDARFNSPTGVVLDRAGNCYVADTNNHTIRKISPNGVVTTLAGTTGVSGSTDGNGTAARFFYPSGLAIDGTGNLYVAEPLNHTIRKITIAGVVTTLAGQAGVSGSIDGDGANARFNGPAGLTVDVNGNVFVADENNHLIRKIDPSGSVTTIAGAAGTSGTADGTGLDARFNFPNGVTADSTGTLYIPDGGNRTIRKITPAGIVTTLAGAAGEMGNVDGTGSAARFTSPASVASDGTGNLFVTDYFTIRKITPSGAVTTLAGAAGIRGADDGLGSNARFSSPSGVAVDANGNIYVGDGGSPIQNDGGNTVRKIDPAGTVTTLAGLAGGFGSADGIGPAARFYSPIGVAVDPTGNIFVTDTLNETIRKVTPSGVVTTIAGTVSQRGSVDGTGSAARFFNPEGLVIDASGNLVVIDSGNNTIRKITPAGVVTTLAGAAGITGSSDGPAADARFYQPTGITVNSTGDLFVTDEGNRTIRKITSTGVVTTVAGTPGVNGSADGTGANARFSSPNGITTDGSDNLFVTDNDTIRMITADGVVTTLAGSPGVSGNTDGTGTEARFSDPTGLVRDSHGNLFVADMQNHTIRKISPSGVVVTLAGVSGAYGSADGTGREARFYFPFGLALDGADNLYVANTLDHNIRRGLAAGAPVIATQPKAETVVSGSSFSASVIAAAAPPPSYQWYLNGQPFSGATSSTLSFTNASSSDAGDYTVVVSNSLGSVTSNTATLTVSSSATSTTPGSSTSGGNSGGGSVGGVFGLALAALAMGRLGFAARRR